MYTKKHKPSNASVDRSSARGMSLPDDSALCW